MKDVFLNKIRNNEYISNKLYQLIKDEYPNFDIEEYNLKVLNMFYNKY